MTKRYSGVIQDHFCMKSANKGTDGIEFVIDLDQVEVHGAMTNLEPKITRRAWLWFPQGKKHDINLKKLAALGWRGGSLQQMDLIGNRVVVVSEFEVYDGEEREKFDFPFPGDEFGDYGNKPSENAALAIDAILRSAPVPAVDQTPAGSAPAPAPAPATPPKRVEAEVVDDYDPRTDPATAHHYSSAVPNPDDDLPY